MFCTLVCSLLVSLCCRCSAEDSETVTRTRRVWRKNLIYVRPYGCTNWVTGDRAAVGSRCIETQTSVYVTSTSSNRRRSNLERCTGDGGKKQNIQIDIQKPFHVVPVFIYQVSHFPRPCHVVFAIGHASECQSHYVWVGWTCLNPTPQTREIKWIINRLVFGKKKLFFTEFKARIPKLMLLCYTVDHHEWKAHR